MSLDLEHIRALNPIEALVGQHFSLEKRGNRFVGTDHDSLVVIPATGFYFWHSRGEHGDVFDFVGRHVLGQSGWNARDPQQFWRAVELLAERAGVPIESGRDLKQSALWNERQLVARLHEALLANPAALAYATKTRGWASCRRRRDRCSLDLNSPTRGGQSSSASRQGCWSIRTSTPIS